MKTSLFIFPGILLSIFLFSCTYPSGKDASTEKIKSQIDTYLQSKMALHEIPGLALAVVKGDETVYEAYVGEAFPDKKEALEKKHLFRIYSTTKLLSGLALFQLIEEGKLSLEDSLGRFFGDFPLRWKQVRVKNLLTHSSGLPDIIRYENYPTDKELFERMFQDDFDFETGERFSYNQTNYWLIAQIIEQLSGKSFGDFVLQRQFPEENAGALFSSNSIVEIPNRISLYQYNNGKGTYERSTYNDGPRAHAGNGLNITLEALTQWAIRLNKNEMINSSTKDLMWTPFAFGNKRDRFLHGWGMYEVNGKQSYGFTGGNVSAFRLFVENEDLTVVLMTNGYRYFPVHNSIVNHVAGLVDSSLKDKSLFLTEELEASFLKGEITPALEKLSSMKEQHPSLNTESIINSLGYVMMRNGRIKDAIDLFERNVADYPESSNVYDSLGEAYLNDGQLASAKKNYEKALELDPESRNAQRMLKAIEKN